MQSRPAVTLLPIAVKRCDTHGLVFAYFLNKHTPHGNYEMAHENCHGTNLRRVNEFLYCPALPSTAQHPPVSLWMEQSASSRSSTSRCNIRLCIESQCKDMVAGVVPEIESHRSDSALSSRDKQHIEEFPACNMFGGTLEPCLEL
mmetsp:Transcript_6654/g.19705  ORF Transcript_6654/g.19705 Transcript_6654/m.19705 type:complete len:145 (+) Transcript_6654:496-930(+)